VGDDMTLENAIGLAAEIGHVLVTTASAEGVPHLAAAGRITARSEGHVAVTEWFCPGTMRNLEENSHVALVVWDASHDAGYQLLGEVVAINEVAALGCLEESDSQPEQPTIERELVVGVEQVLAFSQGPHSDLAP
jgi:uncharacterized protein